jgi:hypothetical protein
MRCSRAMGGIPPEPDHDAHRFRHHAAADNSARGCLCAMMSSVRAAPGGLRATGHTDAPVHYRKMTERVQGKWKTTS